MEHLKGLGMKGPVRPAPTVPAFTQNRFSPVTNWNDDPFSADLFEPAPSYQKKKPPPRPPPPKLQPKPQPDIPAKPLHFNRKPTILSSLMSRKQKNAPSPVTTQPLQSTVHQKFSTEFQIEMDQKLFPKCDLKKENIQTASLIDLSSPPSSPTFTTRSSSDGLSIDSFGSDATSSTNHQRPRNGNASQAESGFEDDFDLFLNNRKIRKEDTLDDFANFDPFSPPPLQKPLLLKKPAVSKGFSEQLLCNGKTAQPAVQTHSVPTIIRAKPARPKPPENSALLKCTFAQTALPNMNLNMSVPIQRANAGIDYYNSNILPLNECEWSPEREASPPMPTVPPPPPPMLDDADILTDSLADWPSDESPTDEMTPVRDFFREDMPPMRDFVREQMPPMRDFVSEEMPHMRGFVREGSVDEEQPYAVALYSYFGDHPEDLAFDVNAKIRLIRRINEEWLYGRTRSGAEGVFPANYVEIKVPLPEEKLEPPLNMGTATALYEFEPSHPGDLRLACGAPVTVIEKVNDEWYFGESNGNKGQFPANYVQMH